MAGSAKAAVMYSFEVTPDFGPLLGDTYLGTLEYDDSGLTGIGEETVGLSDFDFSFLGSDFMSADDPFAFVQLFDGVFLGVEYSAPEFQFLSGIDPFDPSFSSIDNAFFAYDVSAGAGFGNIKYTSIIAPPPPATSIPDPSTVLGLIGVGFIGIRMKRRSQEPV
ncbi:MAG: PEP-CTERM sorting domain-containing protein [Limnothrix sp. RL_2_0]|nr:PEP-CTERM sorting domain-containing protein [Limnothrix sp. RL_2_0]